MREVVTLPPTRPNGGQHSAGRDVRGLGPRSVLARRLDAAAPTLVPHQASRPPVRTLSVSGRCTVSACWHRCAGPRRRSGEGFSCSSSTRLRRRSDAGSDARVDQPRATPQRPRRAGRAGSLPAGSPPAPARDSSEVTCLDVVPLRAVGPGWKPPAPEERSGRPARRRRPGRVRGERAPDFGTRSERPPPLPLPYAPHRARARSPERAAEAHGAPPEDATGRAWPLGCAAACERGCMR